MPYIATFAPQPGSWGDVATLSGFWHHFRRGVIDYGTFLFPSGRQGEGISKRLFLYMHDLVTREGLYLIAPMLITGIMILCHPIRNPLRGIIYKPKNETAAAWSRSNSRPWKHKRVGILLVVAYVVYLLVFHTFSDMPLTKGLLYGVHMRFWQQPNVLAFFFFGVGYSAVMSTVLQYTSGKINH